MKGPKTKEMVEMPEGEKKVTEEHSRPGKETAILNTAMQQTLRTNTGKEKEIPRTYQNEAAHGKLTGKPKPLPIVIVNVQASTHLRRQRNGPDGKTGPTICCL